MKRLVYGILAGVLLIGGCAAVSAADADDPGESTGWFYDGGLRFRSEDGRFALEWTNLFQGRFTQVEPEETGDSIGSFDIESFKVRLRGRVLDDWKFQFEANLADGSETSEDLLEDAFVVYARRPMAQAWVGQGKTFFGRQELTDRGLLQFVSRSIVSERFTHGRDVGLALLGENDKSTYQYQVGLYNGEGINKDASDNRDYMVTARLVVAPLGPLPEAENDRRRDDKNRVAFGVSVLTNTVGTEGIEETRVSRGGLEFDFRSGGYNVRAEFFTESADPVLGDPGEEIDTDGWYLQNGYLFRNGFEIAGRYAEIAPENDDRSVIEYAGVLAWHFSKQRGNKLMLEVRDLTFKGIETTPFVDTQLITVQLQLWL